MDICGACGPLCCRCWECAALVVRGLRNRIPFVRDKEGTAQSKFYILKVTGTVHQIGVATSCLDIESRKHLKMMAVSRDIFPSSAMPSPKRTKHNDCYLGESSRTIGTDTQNHAKS